ncbi:MAG: DegV family protein [Eubacteriales bacterium]|nr:DegV family protein [Eubacteriales bacterium]
MAIRIITDSGSDITQSTAGRWGIRVLPLSVRFGDEEYEDDVTLKADDMYLRMIDTGEIPKTSQVSPGAYEEAFREAVEAGDEVICITVSSGLSGCYQSAMIAAEEFEDKVSVVDSLNVCASQFVLVRYALVLARHGSTRGEIVRRLERNRKRLHVIALVDTLEYARKGGRVSRTAALAGGLLGIKPIITAGPDGKVDLIGKARGMHAGFKLFSKLVDKTGGIDFRLPVCMAYSGLDDSSMRDFMSDQATLFEGQENHIHYSRIGATVGTYSGPNAFAIGFFSN